MYSGLNCKNGQKVLRRWQLEMRTFHTLSVVLDSCSACSSFCADFGLIRSFFLKIEVWVFEVLIFFLGATMFKQQLTGYWSL